MPARVLVTGGSGFIGTNLVQHYSRLGCEILNLDREPPRDPEHLGHWQRLDILERDQLRAATQAFRPELIFHMAARTDLDGASVADYRTNTEGVENMVHAARAVPKLRGVTFASSMLVCELGYRPRDELDFRPTTAYGASKALGEAIVRCTAAEAFPWVIVRPTSIWGPWFDVPYRSFFNAVARGLYLHPRGVSVRRSYGFVYNTVFLLDKLVRAAEHGTSGHVFYLADYEPVELRTWAEKIRQVMNASKVHDVPLPLLDVLARAGDVLKLLGLRNPPLSSLRLRNLLTEAVYDLAPTRAVCGDLPFGTDEAISITVEWMRQH